MIGEHPSDWSLWLPLAKWWYNSTYHTTLHTTLYEALYGQPPPHYLPYLVETSIVACVDRSIKIKQLVDKHRLQPYRQHSVRKILNQKLAPKYFGPVPIVGYVAYTLQLSQGSHIHPTFHVSQLKKHVHHQSIQLSLPLVGPDGTLSKEPVCILDRRIIRCGNQAVAEVLLERTKMLHGRSSNSCNNSFLTLILEDKDPFNRGQLTKRCP
ncbi:BSD domain-containing protein 1-A-like [Gossypium australe]|uniref:BSD domain-containing protein 1-A-like n=1 Tax=Gossypium australe TaxID=47621 RepID=A0A5B6WSP7_9ROSI|nr:BSD domain-containing protein 1-A-like [Gossypium australe]